MFILFKRTDFNTILACLRGTRVYQVVKFCYEMGGVQFNNNSILILKPSYLIFDLDLEQGILKLETPLFLNFLKTKLRIIIHTCH